MDVFSDLGIEPSSSRVVESQPVKDNTNTIKFNRNFLPTPILHLFILLFQFALWICVAAVTKPISGSYYLDTKSINIRAAFLVFSILGFIISAFIFGLIISNIVNFKIFEKLPCVLLIIIADGTMIFPIFILSILAAISESDIRNVKIENQIFLNYGAFAAASIGCFLGIISSVFVKKYDLNIRAASFEIDSTRDWFLSISIFGFLINLLIMILDFVNIFDHHPFNKISLDHLVRTLL
ncbi:unnamed protein product [Brachionus calyciflorus]|uniref:Uncharacterized protein n=1 Tax=Brachionus calyciflorus TaxID=104777 RepID=A0A813M330_9BILA|nr:unnamed protein product [Brachionus calyciflorus]